MGWWEADDQGTVIGDDPADRLTSAFRDLVSGRRERGAPPKPTLPQFLASVREALRRYFRDATEMKSPGAEVADVTAVLTPGDNLVHPDPQGDEDDIRVLADAFGATAEDYRDVLDRDPSVREIVATVNFILPTEQHGLLADLGDNSIARLVLSP